MFEFPLFLLILINVFYFVEIGAILLDIRLRVNGRA
jgi:hypothetical protein